jgi:hypothetical protein
MMRLVQDCVPEEEPKQGLQPSVAVASDAARLNELRKKGIGAICQNGRKVLPTN